MSYNYILKVWLSTIMAGPFILAIATLITTEQTDSGAFLFILLGILFGFVFSLPTLLGCLLFIFMFDKTIKKLLIRKISLISISLIGVIATFYILYGQNAYNPAQLYSALTFTLYILPALLFLD